MPAFAVCCKFSRFSHSRFSLWAFLQCGRKEQIKSSVIFGRALETSYFLTSTVGWHQLRRSVLADFSSCIHFKGQGHVHPRRSFKLPSRLGKAYKCCFLYPPWLRLQSIVCNLRFLFWRWPVAVASMEIKITTGHSRKKHKALLMS